jgi:3-oxoacyl-[acyl-carrier-protein] synthase II
MPASHVAIFNDFRGPSNSITLREASSNLSIAEAVTSIRRGAADAALAGSTGSRIHPLRTLHCSMQEQLAAKGLEPASASRPFDAARTGMVIGEGAGVVTLEELGFARARGATVFGEVVGYGSSTVASRKGVPDFRQAFRNVIRMALQTSGLSASDIGHVHAHGLATIRCDEEEALAIRELLGDVPVVAAKANMGNLGAGAGMVELIASLLALRAGRLFPQINCEQPDPRCPVRIDGTGSSAAGSSFLSLNISPQGQASSILVRAL